jgi:hypothetical protein
MKKKIQEMFCGLAVLGLCLLVSGCGRQDPGQDPGQNADQNPGRQISQDPGLFETPEAAIQAWSELIGKKDQERVEAIFGPGSFELFKSGDDDADQEDGERVKAMILAGVEFEDFDENTRIALLGEQAWPWPIPLVRDGAGWRFDSVEGREELLNRRIGRNELWTLTALHEYVEAQHEYRSQPRDGNPPAYAQRFSSTEGKRDGLYWTAAEGEELSPLGELLAESDVEESNPQPFHGYYYRILTSQGASAPGGDRDYLDDSGLMTGGFAVIAWPAKYGNSGVMTFMTNHRGLIFQKDLGAETEQAVSAIQSFDPDDSWVPTGDRMEEVDPQ